MNVYLALAITATIAISIALWGLHEAKKYRAYEDTQRKTRRYKGH